MNTISIIIPAYNEEAAVSIVVKKIKEVYPNTELIVVDDGSTDKTAQIAETAGARVIKHDKNIGQGASMKTGAMASSGDYILYCDADGQHSVEDVGKLYEECLKGEYDLIVGMRGKDSHVPFTRKIGKYILRRFADYLAGEKIPDLNSGLRAFKREKLMSCLHLMPDQFSFSTTSTFAMMKTNQRIKYIPIKVLERIGNSSVRQIRHGSQALLLILRLTVLFEPLKVFLNATAVLLMLAFLSLGLDIYHDIQIKKIGVGQVTILLFISTLIVFLFGLVCDQVSAIRRADHGKY